LPLCSKSDSSGLASTGKCIACRWLIKCKAGRCEMTKLRWIPSVQTLALPFPGLSRPVGGCRHCRVRSVDCTGAAQQSAWPLLSSTLSFYTNHQQRAPARLPPPRSAQGSFTVSLSTGTRATCPSHSGYSLARLGCRKRRVVQSRLATCIRRQPDQPAFDLASDCTASITNRALIICAATISLGFISTMPVRIPRPRVPVYCRMRCL